MPHDLAVFRAAMVGPHNIAGLSARDGTHHHGGPMWLLATMLTLEVVALGAFVHWWRRPASAFLGGEAGRARWCRRLLVGLATAWFGVGLLPVAAYFVLSARSRPGDEPTVEQAAERAFVRASPEACLAVVSDFERYPEWAETEAVEVVEHDGRGRATVVRIAYQAPTGATFLATMAYEYGEAPLSLRTRVLGVEAPEGIDGEMADAMAAMTSSMRAEYRFEPDGGQTLVAYDLTVALPPALPGFLAGRMASMMASRSVQSLCARLDALAPEGGVGTVGGERP